MSSGTLHQTVNRVKMRGRLSLFRLRGYTLILTVPNISAIILHGPHHPGGPIFDQPHLPYDPYAAKYRSWQADQPGLRGILTTILTTASYEKRQMHENTTLGGEKQRGPFRSQTSPQALAMLETKTEESRGLRNYLKNLRRVPAQRGTREKHVRPEPVEGQFSTSPDSLRWSPRLSAQIGGLP